MLEQIQGKKDTSITNDLNVLWIEPIPAIYQRLKLNLKILISRYA